MFLHLLVLVEPIPPNRPSPTIQGIEYSIWYGIPRVYRAETYPKVQKHTLIWVFLKIMVPQIIHYKIGFSIIFTIHFWGKHPYFWISAHMLNSSRNCSNLSSQPGIHRFWRNSWTWCDRPWRTGGNKNEKRADRCVADVGKNESEHVSENRIFLETAINYCIMNMNT